MTRDNGPMRPSFTLVELLITIALVAMLSATALFALYGVQEHAKLARTKASVARINAVLMEQWESYLTRPVPVRILPSDALAAAAGRRLNGVRELMRLHLPDRKSDLLDDPVFLTQPRLTPPPPPLQPLLVSQFLSFRRKADRMVRAARGPAALWQDNTTGWTLPHQGAECLYLILASIRDGDSSALDYFVESEIGDVDQDGMREILDGWGRPIEFLRWAPGFVTGPGPDGAWGAAGVDDDGNSAIDDEMEAGFPGTDDGSEVQPRNTTNAPDPDPFDPRGVDTRGTFALIPLIYSAGQDGVYDIVSDFASGAVRYSLTAAPYFNDPYITEPSTNLQLGRPADADDANNSGNPDGILQCWDNISNHLVETK